MRLTVRGPRRVSPPTLAPPTAIPEAPVLLDEDALFAEVLELAASPLPPDPEPQEPVCRVDGPEQSGTPVATSEAASAAPAAAQPHPAERALAIVAEALRTVAARPPDAPVAAPEMHFHLAAPDIALRVDPPHVDARTHVEVATPEQAAPVVNVDVQPPEAPVVNVSVEPPPEPRPRQFVVRRDEDGRLAGVEEAGEES